MQTLAEEGVTAALVACAGGDRMALRRLYESEAGRMLGVADRLLRRRSLAEEAVHDTFLQVWRRASSFDPARGAGRAWLYTLLRNRALNMLRQEARTELTDTPLDHGAADDAIDPEAAVMQLEAGSRLRDCLERLEPARREAIVLAYAHGLSHGQLAARLGEPLGTVKSWIRRGMLSLRECLQWAPT